jgi:hypothetical protein
MDIMALCRPAAHSHSLTSSPMKRATARGILVMQLISPLGNIMVDIPGVVIPGALRLVGIRVAAAVVTLAVEAVTLVATNSVTH